MDPALRIQQEGDNQPEEEQQKQRRELTVEDEQEIWRDITLTQYKHTNLTPQKTILCKNKFKKNEKDFHVYLKLVYVFQSSEDSGCSIS